MNNPLPLSWNDTVRIANQVNRGLWLMDVSGKMTAEEAFSADESRFQPFPKLHQPFSGGHKGAFGYVPSERSGMGSIGGE